MAGLVFACVVPHGFPIIPELSDDAEGALATRAAMEEVGRRCAAAAVDVLVVATPHGVRVDGTIALASVARGAGTLRYGGRAVEMNVPVDGPLTDLVAERAREHGVPVALTGFAGNRRDQSVIPLDWGVITPLWFLGHGRNMVGHGDALAPAPEDIGPPVVIAAPSRLLPRTAMVEFGMAVAEAAAHSGQRVGLVASSDWGHTHRADGPYGFSPVAAEVDARVLAALRAGEPGRLITLSEAEVRAAAIDGLWQTLMLAGALDHTPLRGEVLSYEVPSYYSMIVAVYTPAG
ncbi:MAG TPA: aromatic ring-opening dioxygenase subunit LigB [Thermomicrobiaceae bacterium]|nr:aromatic ring-opening dioxygenase subunit LigB [Thermomicrobiaceae bacterium]